VFFLKYLHVCAWGTFSVEIVRGPSGAHGSTGTGCGQIKISVDLADCVN